MDINGVCDAIAQAVTDAEITVNGALLRATGYLPDAVVVPHFAVCEFVSPLHKSFGGLTHLDPLTCRLFLSRSDDQSGQRAARQLAGDNGIAAAIEAARGAPGEPALGGLAQDLVVQRVSGPRLFQVGSAEFYGLEFFLFVMG